MKAYVKFKSFILSNNSSIQNDLKDYKEILIDVNIQHSQLIKKTDNELQKLSRGLIKIVQKENKINLDDLLTPAFSLVKEVCIRQLKITPFDVQILGAIGLQKGKLIEMQTGEGKTITAVFSAYLNALTKKGVHILTFNDYLAKRDATWMSPIFEFMGLSVGFISEEMNKSEKKKSYNCDITYATAKEVGFDYLRSEILASYIRDQGIWCEILNAKNDEYETKIISKAGMLNAVTISTNMAGRGTDIILGGPDKQDIDQIVNLGGLYVIGTNRHESSRVDWQLRGRSGRQGDVGMSRFFVSLKDDLMVKYNILDSFPRKYKSIIKKKVKEKIRRELIDHIQRVIEGQMFDLRRSLYNYSELVEKQKVILKDERLRILTNGFKIIKEHLPMMRKNIRLRDRYKIQELILFQYDFYWARHLDYLSELREGIHLLRIGGQNPLREFQKNADASFQTLLSKIDFETRKKIKWLIEHPTLELSDLGVTKPSSTWTYIVNDFPFGNQLGYMLTDSSNIGFQVDFLSLIILAIFKIFKKKVKKERN